MSENKRCTTFSYLTAFVGLHWALFIGCALFAYLAIDRAQDIEAKGTTTVVVFACLATIFLIGLVVSFVLTVRAGWISPVLFDNEKVCQRQHGKMISWYWQDITDISCHTHRAWPFKNSLELPLFKIKCCKHNYTLSFVATKQVRQQFTSLCTNQAINEKFSQLLKECGFYYTANDK